MRARRTSQGPSITDPPERRVTGLVERNDSGRFGIPFRRGDDDPETRRQGKHLGASPVIVAPVWARCGLAPGWSSTWRPTTRA
jgi:hypothetical protein